MAKRHIDSARAMKTAARDIIAGVRAGEVLLLIGELGVGKTTFVQGVADALGVTGAVTSPTFSIVHEYEISHQKVTTLVHLDLYRLDFGDADTDPAVRDALSDCRKQDRITVIEWADRLAHQPTPAHVLFFTHGDDGTERVLDVMTR